MEELNLLCEALSKSHTDTTYFNATNGLTFADFEWTDNPITESQFDAVVASIPKLQINTTSQAYLDSTDWYITRHAETAVAVPADVTTARAAARAAIV
jgi:hypothetical protein